MWGLGHWNRGEKDIQTGVESESLHHGQEVPEGRAPAPLWMPLGIIIVLQVRNIGRHGTQCTCTRACTGGGLGAAPGYWISTGFLRWKVRPATSWELDLGGHQRVRQLLCLCLQPPVSWAVWPLLCASLSASAPFSSLKTGFLCLFMASLLSTPPSSSLFAGLL